MVIYVRSECLPFGFIAHEQSDRKLANELAKFMNGFETSIAEWNFDLSSRVFFVYYKS